MKKALVFLAITLEVCTTKSWALTNSVTIIPTAAVLVSSNPSVANAVATITISTPTGSGSYSTGFYNYLYDLHVVAYATATVTGSGTPFTCTITGFPIAPIITMETAMAVGTVHARDFSFTAPLQATQGSQVVISCPAKGSVMWDLSATYFVGP